MRSTRFRIARTSPRQVSTVDIWFSWSFDTLNIKVVRLSGKMRAVLRVMITGGRVSLTCRCNRLWRPYAAKNNVGLWHVTQVGNDGGRNSTGMALAIMPCRSLVPYRRPLRRLQALFESREIVPDERSATHVKKYFGIAASCSCGFRWPAATPWRARARTSNSVMKRSGIPRNSIKTQRQRHRSRTTSPCLSPALFHK